MAGVFISYRRDDSPGHAGRIFDSLRSRLGADKVFMDVHAIDAGEDFVDALEAAVGSCDALLAVIGPGWLSASDSHGHRRLDEPLDFVRLEISAALKRDVRVVPVLVDHADLPRRAALPDDLKALTGRNAVELRDSRWDADVNELVGSMERLIRASRRDGVGLAERLPSSGLFGRRSRVWGAAATLVLVGAGATFSSRACVPERDEAMPAAADARPAPKPRSAEATSDRGNTATAPVTANRSKYDLRILAFGLGLAGVTDMPPGVIVGHVQPGGPAAIAGILPGDVLVNVAGRFPDGSSSVADAVVEHMKTTPAGTPGVVDIVRQGEHHTFFVVFDRAYVLPR